MNDTYQLSLIDSNCYSVDTCVFLDMWLGERGMYPKEIYVGLWEHFQQLVDGGRIFIHNEVYDELKAHAEEDVSFKTWLKDNKSKIVINSVQSTVYAQKVINDYVATFKGGYRPTVKNAADPFVVGLAMEKSAIVLTQEKRLSPGDLKSANVPKIPNMCDEFKLKHVDINGFLRSEGLQLQHHNPIQASEYVHDSSETTPIGADVVESS